MCQIFYLTLKKTPKIGHIKGFLTRFWRSREKIYAFKPTFDKEKNSEKSDTTIEYDDSDFV